MKKRLLLSCLIAATGMTGSWAQTAQIERFEEDGIAYNITDAEALTVEVTELVEAGPDVTGYTGDITIPATVTHEGNTYRVTKIGDYAFADNSGYIVNTPTSITIPEGVTTIGKWAFYQCQELASVSIPASIDSIGLSTIAGQRQKKGRERCAMAAHWSNGAKFTSRIPTPTPSLGNTISTSMVNC